MKAKYVIDPDQELSKSLSSSSPDDYDAVRLAVKIALLKSLPQETWVTRIFNRISVERPPSGKN